MANPCPYSPWTGQDDFQSDYFVDFRRNIIVYDSLDSTHELTLLQKS